MGILLGRLLPDFSRPLCSGGVYATSHNIDYAPSVLSLSGRIQDAAPASVDNNKELVSMAFRIKITRTFQLDLVSNPPNKKRPVKRPRVRSQRRRRRLAR
jgi:hypothetical protein